MNFIGTGKRLNQGDIGEAARLIGIPTAGLLAFLEVEASGRGFDNQNRPKMLFEPHVFYRELAGISGQALAVAQGLAYPKWGTQPYPKDSYPRLNKALGIHKPKALRSSSWGLSQVLGDKAGICGFGSEEQFVRAMMQGEREQLIATVTLMKHWGIGTMLQGKDLANPNSWRPAASKWNGKSYAVHNYHGKLANAFIKHNGQSGFPDKMVITDPNAILQRGMRGEPVLNIQKDLASLGYIFEYGIDGRFGDETDKHVRDFQAKNNLTVDGIVGTNTLKALKAALENSNEDKSPAPPVWDGQEPKPKSKANPLIIAIVIIVAIIGFGIAKFFNLV